MYGLIIVDDELLVRLGVKSYIQSGATDFEILGTFANGREALDFCRRHKPDIVLTDLLMPVMDGLQLIEQLQKLDPAIKIIVLSCHEDYKLVKAAFKLGVHDYILKHEMEMAELFQVLDKVKKELPLKREPENTVFKETLYGYERNSIIQSLLSGGMTREETARTVEKIQQHRLRLSEGNIVVICLSIDRKYDETGLPIKTSPDIMPVLNTLDEIFQKYETGEIYLKENEFIGVFCFPDEPGERRILEKINAILRDLREAVKNYFNSTLAAGISSRHHHFTEIPQAYTEAHEALLANFYKDQGGTTHYYEISTAGEKPSFRTDSLKDLIIDKNSYTFNGDGIEEYLRSFFDRAAARTLSPDQLKRELINLTYLLNETIADYFGIRFEQIFGIDFTVYRQIEQFDKLEPLQRWAYGLLRELRNQVKKKAETLPHIAKIKEYIKDHYQENLSLKQVAAVFHLNTNYFCQYFKKETGVNFIDYLTGLRVEKAKLLLKSSGLTTGEIAARVGFSNPNYFVKVFKKVTGFSISEYKRAK